MAKHTRVTLEIGPKGNKVVAVAPDWPGLERGANTGEAAIERLLSYIPRYSRVAKLAAMDAEFDGITNVEVVEHLDPWRLRAFAGALFGSAKPALVLLTTPNSEFNARYPTLPAGRFRHADHRFEWTRAEFTAWAQAVAERHGYAVEFRPIGAVDEALGAPTQMGVFRRCP